MKIICTFFAAMLYFSHLYGSCDWAGLRIFPENETIRQNPVFILEGYSASQDVVTKLNTTYPIFLQYGQKKIRLRVKEVNIGQMMLTQALLIPETTLEAGLEYVIVIEKLPATESLIRYNPTKHAYEPAKYKVLKGTDKDSPILISPPKEIAKQLMNYSCGPASHVIFGFSAKDSSAIFVRATVKNMHTGTTATYLLTPIENKIYIGHGMCAGEFDFDKTINYEVTFSFMDASGNNTDYTGNKITFTRAIFETR